MRVREEVKLNFEDVLMEPKRSTLSSRRDVQMTRKFTFRNLLIKIVRECFVPSLANLSLVSAHSFRSSKSISYDSILFSAFSPLELLA